MTSAVERSLWSLSPDWTFHHHIDGTCSGYNPYSGSVLAFNEATAWILRQLASSSQTSAALQLSLADELAGEASAEIERFVIDSLRNLAEDVRVIVIAENT